MKKTRSIQLKIASALRAIGTKKCLEKAESLEHQLPSITTLNLRTLDLSSSDVESIASCFKDEEGGKDQSIHSIGFSYNHLLGDLGAIALAKNLPASIAEIGLVDCGITDAGGVEILNWMRNATNLKMICMEQNNFSESLKTELSNFSTANAQIIIVY